MSEPCSTPREWLAGACITVAGITIYTVALIWQGFDLTDEGFHLTNHYLIIHDGANFQYGMLWFSNLLGGIWLYFSSPLGLLGARLGWVITLTATGFVSYTILTTCFRPLPSALSVTAAALVIPYHGIMVINQNNISFLILLSAGGSMLAAQRFESYCARSIMYATFGGILLGLAIMARFPLILAIVLPFVAPGVKYLITRQRHLPTWILALISIAVCAVTIVVCAVILHATGHLGGYLEGLSGKSFGKSYSFGRLFRIYWNDALLMLGRTAIFLAAVILLGLFTRTITTRFGIKRWAPVLFGTMVMGFIVLGVRILYVLGVRSLFIDIAYKTYTLILPGVCLSAACFCFFCLWRTSSQSKERVFQLEILATGGVVAVLIMLGSGNGLLNIHHGLWLVFPASCILLPEALEKFSTIFRQGKDSVHSYRPYVIAGVLVLILCSAGIRFVDTYRDLRNRFQLTTQFKHPKLRGVFSSRDRVKSVDELLEQLDKRCKPGDPLLAFNCTPTVHYLTESTPALGISWPVLLNRESLKERLTQLGSQRPVPTVVVRAKTNPRNRNWGNRKKVPPPRKSIQDKLELIDKVIHELGFREVWSNHDFVILVRSEASSLQ